MKTWKQKKLSAIIAIFGISIIVLFLTIGCEKEPKIEDPQCKCPTGTVHAPETPCNCAADCNCSVFSRTFNLAFLGKTVTLKDETGAPTSLEARGIKQKIQDGFDAQPITPEGPGGLKFAAIHATGNFAVVVTNGADYPAGYAVDGYKILFCEDQLAEYSVDYVEYFINAAIMDDMTAPVAKSNTKTLDRLAGGYKQMTGHRIAAINSANKVKLGNARV